MSVFCFIYRWFSDVRNQTKLNLKSLCNGSLSFCSSPSPSVAQLDVTGFNVMKKFIYAVETRGTVLNQIPVFCMLLLPQCCTLCFSLISSDLIYGKHAERKSFLDAAIRFFLWVWSTGIFWVVTGLKKLTWSWKFISINAFFGYSLN